MWGDGCVGEEDTISLSPLAVSVSGGNHEKGGGKERAMMRGPSFDLARLACQERADDHRRAFSANGMCVYQQTSPGLVAKSCCVRYTDISIDKGSAAKVGPPGKG